MAKRKKSVNSNQKGKAGERELSKELQKFFKVKTKRGQQYCGLEGNADVVGIDGIHIESKRVQKLNLSKSLQQAENDRKEEDRATLFSRKNHEPWIFSCYLDDLPDIVEVLHSLKKL